MSFSEVSSIDTAILLCGVLTCRQYFAENERIAALATTFYRRIDWQWMLNGGLRPEDLYNLRLARGWTAGMSQELKLLQTVLRLAHTTIVRRLARHWLAGHGQ